MHRPNEALKIDGDDECSDTDLTFLDQHENYDNQVFESDLHSTEEGFDEFGQELMNFLVRTGKLKEKFTNPPIPTAELVQRHERTRNDRYDELINAFNVILEEIVLHGSLRLTAPKTNCEQSHSVAAEQPDEPSTDHLSRCLSPVEKELLKKIKMLTNQLNSVMKKRKIPKNNEESNDKVHEL